MKIELKDCITYVNQYKCVGCNLSICNYDAFINAGGSISIQQTSDLYENYFSKLFIEQNLIGFLF